MLLCTPVEAQTNSLDPIIPEEAILTLETSAPVAPQQAQPTTPSIAEPMQELLQFPQEDSVPTNVFFDAQSVVPNAQQNVPTQRTPRVVDPRREPGSTLVLVEKDHKAGSYQAGLVSAQRAIKLGRYEAALAILTNLYMQNNRDPAMLMHMAVAYQHSGQNDFAVQKYEELLDINPDHVEARVNMLGILGEKYPAVAMRQLQELQDDNPENISVMSQLAVVAANVGEFKDAMRYLSIAASIEPQNASHVFNMAVIADRAGDQEMALQYYEQALEIDTLYGKSASIPRGAVFERLADLR